MWRCLIAVLAVIGFDGRSAEACTCFWDFRLPYDQTADVPVNLHDIVIPGGAADVYELRGGGVTIVLGAPRNVSDDRQQVQLVPVTEPLAPNTDYTVSPFFLTTSFRTGAAPDTEPPGPVGFEDIAINYVDPDSTGSTCGVNRRHFSGRLAVPADAASLWIRFRDQDGNVQERLMPARDNVLQFFQTDACSIAIELTPDTTYELEVSARDLAGNEGPASTTSVYIRNVDSGGCATTKPSGYVLAAIVLLIRRRRVAAIKPGA